MNDPTNGDLHDRIALLSLLAELSSAVDRGDRERITACYTTESFDDHGSFKGSGTEFANLICGRGRLSTMHHLLGQSIFEICESEAWGETFYSFHGRAGDHAVSGHGRYVDYFTKHDGRWQITYRRVVPDFVPAGDDLGAYWPPTRDRRDPSYDRLRWPPADTAPS